MALTSQEMLAEIHRLVQTAESRNIQVRAIGGLAVRIHDRTAHPLFARDFADLDVVVAKKQRREFEAFMPEAGYAPDRQFNLLNGAERQIYHDETRGIKVDVFVGDFVMCHKIPLESRLRTDPVTIPLAELLLSKAQILELNRKDALDISSILFNNEATQDDSGINLQVLAQLCGADWGLYKTVSINLGRVGELIAKESALDEAERGRITARAAAILKTFEDMPKPMAWQLRDRVGTRVKWYIEVEEVDRG